MFDRFIGPFYVVSVHKRIYNSWLSTNTLNSLGLCLFGWQTETIFEFKSLIAFCLQNEFLINNVWKKIRKSRFLIKTNSRNRNNEYLLSPNFGWRISLTNCSTLEPHLNFERFEAPIYIIILFCFSVSLLIKPILFYFYSYIGNFAHAITALSAPNKQANKNTNNIQMQRKKSIQ